MSVRSTGLAISVGRARGTVVVRLRGQFGPADADRFAALLRDLTIAQGNLTVAVDVRGLTSLDPATAAILAAASVWAREHGGTFAICDPRPTVAHELAAAGLDQDVQPRPTRSTAAPVKRS